LKTANKNDSHMGRGAKCKVAGCWQVTVEKDAATRIYRDIYILSVTSMWLLCLCNAHLFCWKRDRARHKKL